MIALMPTPSEPALETTAPRGVPPPALRASVRLLLRLHDHGLLDAPTTRRALAFVRRGATLPEVLEAAGVPHSLRDKADELVRPLTTRLDGAAAAALALVPPALAALAGELTRVAGLATGAALVLAGAAALGLARSRALKAGGAAVASAAIVSLLAPTLSTPVDVVLPAMLAAAGAAAFALRPVTARARCSAGGVAAGGLVEAVRASLSG